MNTKHIPALFLGLLLFALGGCASLLDPGPPLTRFIVNPELPAKHDQVQVKRQLAVSAPEAGTALTADRIVGLFNGREVRYLGTGRWYAPLPWLMQRLLVEALEHSGRFAGVSVESSGFAAEIRLTSELRSFYLIFEQDNAAPVAEVSMSMQLTDIVSGRMLGSKTITVQEPSQGTTVLDFVKAFESALARMLDQTGIWAATTAESPRK